jgi:hypothetical protein
MRFSTAYPMRNWPRCWAATPRGCTASTALRRDQFWILPPSAEQDAKVRERLDSILARTNPVLHLW